MGPAVTHTLPGWTLLWADLELTGGGTGELAGLRERTAAQARDRYSLETLSSDPTVAALRKLFRAAGTDPTRYRPSSEALLRRVLKGDEIPEISPLVDLNNCLSAALAVPACVMDARTVDGPYELRAGAPEETYESLRGPFNLAGRPLLVDAHGPCDTPITGNTRVKVRDDTTRAWLVAYMPSETEVSTRAEPTLNSMLAEFPIARIHDVGRSF